MLTYKGLPWHTDCNIMPEDVTDLHKIEKGNEKEKWKKDPVSNNDDAHPDRERTVSRT
jgi:hypothetical protein